MTYVDIDGWVFATSDIQLIGPVQPDPDTGCWQVPVHLRADPNPFFITGKLKGDLQGRRDKLLELWAGTSLTVV